MKEDENIFFVKNLLDEAYLKYNRLHFIENDPILIPHQFTKKEDIEIAAFLAASIAWGNRKSIIQNGKRLMQFMDEQPYEFICHHRKSDLKAFNQFVHRTFNANDCVFFIQSLQNIYLNHGGLEQCFVAQGADTSNIKPHILSFREVFFSMKHLNRTEKHVSNPDKNSSAKRLCMFLRWMVRKDRHGVDFGIWSRIQPAQLCLPLDVHTGTISRLLGLLKRKQNDWKSVEEITSVLKQFDKKDPIKYDFSLFGLGANKDLDF